MHDAILRQLRSSRTLSLSKISTGRVSTIAAYDELHSAPLWIAKTSCEQSSILNLRRERDALEYLGTWASVLNIPRVLAFEEDCRCACLIMTGVPGVNARPGMHVTKSPKRIARYIERIIPWLSDFQRLVPAPNPIGSQDLLLQLHRTLYNRPELAPQVVRLLAAVERFSASFAPVSVHGDFAAQNVMFAPDRFYVIDWSTFDSGFPLQDLFTFVGGIEYYVNGRLGSARDIQLALFFSDLPICDYVRNLIQKQVSDPGLLRFYYYAYVSKLIANQTAYNDNAWRELLDIFEREGYPGPCSAILRAA